MAESSDKLCLVHHVCGNLHSPHAVHGLKVFHELSLGGRHCSAGCLNVVRYVVPDLQSRPEMSYPQSTPYCAQSEKGAGHIRLEGACKSALSPFSKKQHPQKG